MPNPPPDPARARVGLDRPTNIDREIRGAQADLLGWMVRATRLAQYLLFQVETPITLGIQGDWGSGKSSFINLVETGFGQLQAPPATVPADSPAAQLHHYQATVPPIMVAADTYPPLHVYVLRFDSWAFAQSSHPADELFPVYVARVLEAYLQAENRLPNGPNIAHRFATVLKTGLRIGAVGLAGRIGGESAGQAAADALTTPAPEALVDNLSGFKSDFQRLVHLLLGTRPEGDRYSNRLIIIVDDLDRIAPMTAVEITEKIKVFLDVSGVIFILAADLSIIQEGLRQKFGTPDLAAEGKNYLDKIVKIQYNVPQLQAADLAYLALRYPTFAAAFGLVAGRGMNWDDRSAEPLRSLLEQLMAHDSFRLLRAFPSIGSNIRNSKRVLLNFEFSTYLLGSSRDPDLALRLLAVTVLHQYRHALAQDFYRWLARPAHPAGLRLDAEQRADLLAALAPHGDEAVVAFFDVLLAPAYTVADWLAAYTAALNPLAEPIT